MAGSDTGGTVADRAELTKALEQARLAQARADAQFDELSARLEELHRRIDQTERKLHDLRAEAESVTEQHFRAASAGRNASHQAEMLEQAIAETEDAHRPRTRNMARFRGITGLQVRHFREQASLTQQQLADAMSRAGLAWKRATVAEIEGGGRQVQFDELLLLAALFAVPAIDLLIPRDVGYIVFDTGSEDEGDSGMILEAAQAIELLTGANQELGSGGLEWRTPKVLLGIEDEDWRPAVALWDDDNPSPIPF